MSQSTTAAKDPANSSTEELKALIHEAQEALRDEKDGKHINMEDIRARLRTAVDDGKTLVANMSDAVRRHAGKADDTIRANPYQSIGIAAGIGLLVGLLISRRGGAAGGS
jgi:ElaB/YqjD/DUF883 family membrane-anchored ribosome-binding protein